MARPPVEARRAVLDDLEDLLLLWSQAREELGRVGRAPSPIPAEQFRVRLEETLRGQESIVLIGRCEGSAAGYAVLRLAPVLLVDGDALHIDHLFVLPSARRRGVARALLLAATSIAERHGADQILAGAPPSAKESHRFLARLGFSPLVVRRVVGTAALRRRLAGETQRRGLEDLLSRRRSLRARSLRAGWGRSGSTDPGPEDDPEAEALDDEVALVAGCPAGAPATAVGEPDTRPLRIVLAGAENAPLVDLTRPVGGSCPLVPPEPVARPVDAEPDVEPNDSPDVAPELDVESGAAEGTPVVPGNGRRRQRA